MVHVLNLIREFSIKIMQPHVDDRAIHVWKIARRQEAVGWQLEKRAHCIVTAFLRVAGLPRSHTGHMFHHPLAVPEVEMEVVGLREEEAGIYEGKSSCIHVEFEV